MVFPVLPVSSTPSVAPPPALDTVGALFADTTVDNSPSSIVLFGVNDVPPLLYNAAGLLAPMAVFAGPPAQTQDLALAPTPSARAADDAATVLRAAAEPSPRLDALRPAEATVQDAGALDGVTQPQTLDNTARSAGLAAIPFDENATAPSPLPANRVPEVASSAVASRPAGTLPPVVPEAAAPQVVAPVVSEEKVASTTLLPEPGLSEIPPAKTAAMQPGAAVQTPEELAAGQLLANQAAMARQTSPFITSDPAYAGIAATFYLSALATRLQENHLAAPSANVGNVVTAVGAARSVEGVQALPVDPRSRSGRGWPTEGRF